AGRDSEADYAEKAETDKKAKEKKAPTDVDDGRLAMQKIFVDGRLISPGDFNTFWHTPDLHEAPRTVVEPFIQILAEKGLVPMDKSLKVICERSRIGFLPLDTYDIDHELART